MEHLFVCSRCNCVDMVGLAYKLTLPTAADDQLCTSCRTGEWHGMFPHTPYDPEKDNVINRPTGLSI